VKVRRRIALGFAFCLALCLSIGSIAFADPAYPTNGLDKANGLKNGDLSLLIDTKEVGAGSGNVHTITGGKQFDYDVYWTQPMLHMEQNTKTFDVFGLCVDSAHLINTGSSYTNYTVADYSNSIVMNDGTRTIESQDAWNKLTYMWSQAKVTSDADRAALQLATWKGCANDWDVTRENFWNSGDGSGVQFWFDGTPGLSGKVAEYLGIGASYNRGEVAGYKYIYDGTNQSFVTAVPEPGTIFAACAILSPVGFVFRRRRA